AEGEGKPFAPRGRLAARARRVRRNERGLRHHGLPRLADLDQVVAVGAVAVQEHHELARGAAFRRKAGTVEFSGHFSPASFSVWRALTLCPASLRGFSRRDSRSTTAA